jgi:hypothetical protein
MVNNNMDRPLNFYKITPEDWQIFIKKLFKGVPGSNLADKHEWLSTRLDVSPGTTASWLNKGLAIPNSENQFAMAELLCTPLSMMITQVQLRLDPSPLTSAAISGKMVEAISNIPSEEIPMIAKSLGVTQAQLYGAGSKLIQLAEQLS